MSVALVSTVVVSPNPAPATVKPPSFALAMFVQFSLKVTVMLEELLALGHTGAEYDAWLINIQGGDQFSSGYVKINPNSKIPVMVDQSTPGKPTRVFESGSILLDDPFRKVASRKENELVFIAAFGESSGELIGKRLPDDAVDPPAARDGRAGRVRAGGIRRPDIDVDERDLCPARGQVCALCGATGQTLEGGEQHPWERLAVGWKARVVDMLSRQLVFPRFDGADAVDMQSISTVIERVAERLGVPDRMKAVAPAA